MPTRARRRRRKPLIWAFLAIFLLPIVTAAGALAYRGGPTHWSQWDRTVTSQLPVASEHPDARIMVMTGRTRGWKGVVAVHSWVAFKRENGSAWRRYDVAGWGSPVRLNWWPPDLWFGQRGNTAGSEMLYRLALEFNPNHALAANNYGFGLLERGEEILHAYELIQRAYASLSPPWLFEQSANEARRNAREMCRLLLVGLLSRADYDDEPSGETSAASARRSETSLRRRARPARER